MLLLLILLTSASALVIPRQSASNLVASINSSYVYNAQGSLVGNASNAFLDTVFSNSNVSGSIASAFAKPFISFDDDFLSMVGSNPEVKQIATADVGRFYETGAWAYDKQKMFFTSSIIEGPTVLGVLDLKTNNISIPITSGDPLVNPNGGTYYKGLLYLACFGNETWPAGVYSVDPDTYEVKTVVNHYFGARFTGLDDVTFSIRNGRTFMYFTDPDFGVLVNPGAVPNIQPAVYRFDMDKKFLTQVLNKADVLVPNGIRSNKDGSRLCVTDTSGIARASVIAAGPDSVGSPAILCYDIDDSGFPVNKRIIGYSRLEWPDGIHIDDYGRIWTGEGEGIVVRSSEGQVLGIMNRSYFCGGENFPANFGLIGSRVIYMCGTQMWSIQMSQKVIENRN